MIMIGRISTMCGYRSRLTAPPRAGGLPVDSEDLSHRIRRLEDRAELRELVNRYCLAIDDSDWGALLGLFHTDAAMAGQVGPDDVVRVLRSIRSGYGRTIHTALAQVLE